MGLKEYNEFRRLFKAENPEATQKEVSKAWKKEKEDIRVFYRESRERNTVWDASVSKKTPYGQPGYPARPTENCENADG